MTHTYSDMASFGQTRLMDVAIKRFLKQVKRSEPADYDTLPETLRQRYAPGVNQLFADVAKDDDQFGPVPILNMGHMNHYGYH